MKVHYALAAMAASASALIAPAAMPRALVARPAPTADATVLEVPRPRPLSLLCPSTWLLRLNSPTNYSVAPESKLESELKQARQRLSLANSLVSVAELVFLQQKKSQEGVGFKPQSLRRRGFEPHRMQTHRETDWRNGSASDSSPEGYVFESRIGHQRALTVPPPRRPADETRRRRSASATRRT